MTLSKITSDEVRGPILYVPCLNSNVCAHLLGFAGAPSCRILVPGQKSMGQFTVGGFPVRHFCTFMVAALGFLSFSTPATSEEWSILIDDVRGKDTAIMLAVNDLIQAGKPLGIDFSVAGPNEPVSGNRIVVGYDAVAQSGIAVDPATHQEGFRIHADTISGERLVAIAGGSIAGDVYGLYWLWDRLRVYKEIPEMDVERVPALEIRSGGGPSEQDMRNALRYTVNWTTSADTNSLVSYDDEPLATQNAQTRAATQELIDYAHALHMKFFSVADEFSYLPTVMEEMGASPDPSNDALWTMLQDKYRRLFQAMPAIDGIRIRTGEHTRVVEPWKPYDVMHEPDLPEWPLERRYQTFLQKLHEVVVGEFDKIYYHRTWVTGATEQHSNAEVYRAIFTDAVPTENLYLSPYLTRGDRWFYQPINPTFNLTPHKMLVLLASMNYHEDGSVTIFPTYPGLYFQEGFDKLWRDRESNIVGSQFGSAAGDGWDSNDLTVYTAFRMSWDPLEDPRSIAEDFASIHFGRDVAKTMGEVIMLSGDAYKDGLYIKPVAEAAEWNTLPHLRLTTFPVRGFPDIDRGKEHVQWLYETMYRPCRDRIRETLEYLDQGLTSAERMLTLGQEARADFDDPEVAQRVIESLDLTRLLVQTNNRYVRTCFAFFEYRAERSDAARSRLASEYDNLQSVIEAFRAAPGFGYKLYGIEQLLENVEEALADPERAELALETAPDAEGVADAIAEQQADNRRLVESHLEDAVKILYWNGRVDGKDILSIRGDAVSIEHVAADPIHVIESRIETPLPAKPGTVFVRDIRSSEIHPFVLEHPSAENDYTAKIYFFDPGPGYAPWEMEVYYLHNTPETLDAALPWQR